MSSGWRTVRVFISSTFLDMQSERDHLVKVVFPALREQLEPYRVHLIDIDLRWGVTREQAENDRVLDLCLQQIDECRPFFVGLLGERYGTVPKRIPPGAGGQFDWLLRQGGRSLTELEILHGALNHPEGKRRAFFYFRDPQCLTDIPFDLRRSHYVETQDEKITRLSDLKARIRRGGCALVDGYPARWDPRARDPVTRTPGRLVGLEEFGRHVWRQLWEAIRTELDLPESPPAPERGETWADEGDLHERFLEQRLRVYVARPSLDDELLSFVQKGSQGLCLLTGPSGSGKSAALARLADIVRRQRPHCLVIPHFVGASASSTSLHGMLYRLVHVLRAELELPAEAPTHLGDLPAAFAQALSHVPASRQVVLLIDAADQMDAESDARAIGWLPSPVAEQVRIVLSCADDGPAGREILAALAERAHARIDMPPLSDAERVEILRRVPSLSAKTLDDRQAALLLQNPWTRNPLYLLVALEELRGIGSLEQIQQRIAALPQSENAVVDLFAQVIRRLEEDFDAAEVASVLTLLASARHGLSQQELRELTAQERGAGDLFAVLRQLRPYLLRRNEQMDFYHDAFRQAARQRYLDSADKQKKAHLRLAEYFDIDNEAFGVWMELLAMHRQAGPARAQAARSGGGSDKRGIRDDHQLLELPWQLVQAAQWERLADVLSYPPFITFAHRDRDDSLLDYWTQVEANSPRRMCDAYRPVIDSPNLILDADDEGDHWGLRTIAALLGQRGYTEESLALCLAAAEAYGQTGQWVRQADVLTSAAANQMRLGRLDDAAKSHTKAERLFQRSSQEWVVAENLMNRAVIESRGGKWEQAMGLLTQAEEILRRCGRRQSLAVCLKGKAGNLSYMGDSLAAVDLFEQAQKLARESGDQHLAMECMVSQVEELRILGRLERASELLTQPETFFRRTGLLPELANCLCTRGRVETTRGQHEAARAAVQEAQELYRQIHDPSGLSRALGLEAEILERAGDSPGAALARQRQQQAMRSDASPLSLLAQEEQRARAAGKTELWRVLLNHARTCLIELNDPQGALPRCREAIDILAETAEDLDALWTARDLLRQIRGQLGQRGGTGTL